MAIQSNALEILKAMLFDLDENDLKKVKKLIDDVEKVSNRKEREEKDGRINR